MKETLNNLVSDGNDWHFQKPWSKPIDITKQGWEEELKQASEQTHKTRDEEFLQGMDDESFAQFALEMRILLYQEEVRRFGDRMEGKK